MRKVEKVVCWICNTEHDNETAAEECESKGLMVPYFKIGDTVAYQANLGSDRDGSYSEKRVGTIIDILFPMLSKYHRTGYALLHTYQVSYLVRVARGESESSEFFDQRNIDLLQTLRTVEVVSEANMFFEDGKTYIHQGLDPYTRSRRVIVTSWHDYVTKTVQRSPQLNKRLADFTPKLHELGCLD